MRLPCLLHIIPVRYNKEAFNKDRIMMSHLKLSLTAALIPVLIVSLCSPVMAGRRQYEVSGKTMGTFYSIKFISKKKESPLFWKAKVDTLLKGINKKFSMYDPASELSLFNQKAPHHPISVSADFYAVLRTAKELHTMTGGAWDGTLKPLVDLWGFGTKERADAVPDSDEINRLLAVTGFNRITLQKPMVAVKTSPVTLDFGSIAKGYGVDAVQKLFIASGISNVLVEIGGELSAAGKNRKRQVWTVGIDWPDKSITSRRLFKVLRLRNQSIATSGNYRNFFEADGKTYAHIIDPRTGYPTTNGIISASVVAGSCTFADGLATALMVMDIDEGLGLVNRLENTECLIIQQEQSGLTGHTSKGFDRLLVE